MESHDGSRRALGTDRPAPALHGSVICVQEWEQPIPVGTAWNSFQAGGDAMAASGSILACYADIPSVAHLARSSGRNLPGLFGVLSR